MARPIEAYFGFDEHGTMGRNSKQCDSLLVRMNKIYPPIFVIILLAILTEGILWHHHVRQQEIAAARASAIQAKISFFEACCDELTALYHEREDTIGYCNLPEGSDPNDPRQVAYDQWTRCYAELLAVRNRPDLGEFLESPTNDSDLKIHNASLALTYVYKMGLHLSYSPDQLYRIVGPNPLLGESSK
jgi:hypothetical protein